MKDIVIPFNYMLDFSGGSYFDEGNDEDEFLNNLLH